MSDLEQFIENSRVNETIANKLFEIETKILACQSSHELLERLLCLIRDKFNLDNICLLLVDPTPISYLLSGNMQLSWHKENCYSLSADILKEFHANNKPFLTNQLSQLARIVPEKQLQNAQSAALIPLTLENKLFGSLFFSDSNKERFHAQLGTFHLEQLAVKASLSLSNVLIREQLQYKANYDRLTGVANRRLMEETLNDELLRHRRYQIPFSILFIDCNKFKAINDTYGHDCGDKVLVYVAEQLKALIRDNDKCFRYAGDEFVISLAGQKYDEALLIAQRLMSFFIRHPMPYQGKNIPITISCGAASSDDKHSIDELLKQADQHLYECKHNTAASLIAGAII